MAIYEITKNKKYQVRVSFRNIFSEVQVISRIVNGTLSKAKIVEAELIASSKQDKNDYTNITFLQLFEKYINSREGQIHPETARKYHELYTKYLSKMGKLRMNRIKAINFIDLRTEIENTKASWEQRNKAIYLLKSITRFGYEYLDIKDNAKMLKTIPRANEMWISYNTLTPEEFDYIMTFVDNKVYFAYYNLLYWSGLRKGEARALFKSDIKNNGVDVSKSIIDAKNEITSPKTRSSNRFVPLDTETLELLKPLIRKKGKFLFGDLKPLSTTSITRNFNNAQTKANKALEKENKETIPHIRIHDLRHSHATLLIEAKENVAAVSARLGHSSISETQRTYIHLFKGSDIRIVDTIDTIKNIQKNIQTSTE